MELVPEIEQQIERNLEKILRLTFSSTPSDWSSLWEREEVIASKRTESGLPCVRGETLLPYSIPEIFNLISRADCRRDLDTLIDTNQKLHWFSPQTGVERLTYKAIWPTDPRDFLNITHWRLVQDETLVMVAFRYPFDNLCPAESPFVRGNLLLGGYAMRHEAGGTRIYLVVQVFRSSIALSFFSVICVDRYLLQLLII
jgi:hypothetical protein